MRAIAALNHPHICALYDVGLQDEVEFFVMEYLEGETLADRLVKGPLPMADTLRHAAALADAVALAHRHGVVHRDIKPGNIMLTASGVKLLDFGLAKLSAPPNKALVAGLSDESTLSADITGAHAILGTLRYMAPEQLEGRDADARTDIFALGVVFYEMATGQRAFTHRSDAGIDFGDPDAGSGANGRAAATGAEPISSSPSMSALPRTPTTGGRARTIWRAR